MGISIGGPDDGPIPRRTLLTLTCDGPHSEGRVAFVFQGEGGGYVEQRRAATNAGWRFAGSGKVFGPCCPNERGA